MRILIATDFSPFADTARSLVRNMRLPAGSHIRVVHAIEPVTTVTIFAPAALLTFTEATENEARALVRDTEKALAAPGVTVDGVVGNGRAADVVMDEADSFRPDLLVVGSRGRGAFATNILGSVSAELVDRAPCPVLVARASTLRRTILADDGSENAAAGARAIDELAPLRTASVHVVSVVDAPFPVVFADPTATSTAVEALRDYEAAMPALREQRRGLARQRATALQAAGRAATWEQREGDPAYELIAAAAERHADCIVIGSRGQTGVRRLVIGSVARSVLIHAPCSVLVVHAKAGAPSKEVSASGDLAAAGTAGPR